MNIQKKKFKVTFEIEGKYLYYPAREKLSPSKIRFYVKDSLDENSWNSQSDCKVKNIKVEKL